MADVKLLAMFRMNEAQPQCFSSLYNAAVLLVGVEKKVFIPSSHTL